VFLRYAEHRDGWDPEAMADIDRQEREYTADLYQRTGVQVVILGAGMDVLKVAHHRPTYARRGPTPRWCRQR
jgi:hypothetical protein